MERNSSTTNTYNSTCILYGKIKKNININLPAVIHGQKPISAIFIVIGIFGIILNILVILTILNKYSGKKTANNRQNFTHTTTFQMLLVNLAVTDLLEAVAVVILGAKTIYIINATSDNISKHHLQKTINDLFRSTNIICKVSYSFFFLTNFVSVLTLSSMGIERYRAIVPGAMQPIGTIGLSRWKMRFLLVGIWIISILGATLTFNIVEVTKGVYNRCLFAHYLPNGIGSFNLIYTICISTVFYCLPGMVMTYCYIHIIKELLHHTNNLTNSNQSMNSINTNRNDEKQAAISLIIVTAAFFFMMTPFLIYLWVIAISHCNADEILHSLFIEGSDAWVLIEVSHILYILPPLVNPICYSFSNYRFRQNFKISVAKTKAEIFVRPRKIGFNFCHRS